MFLTLSAHNTRVEIKTMKETIKKKLSYVSNVQVVTDNNCPTVGRPTFNVTLVD